MVRSLEAEQTQGALLGKMLHLAEQVAQESLVRLEQGLAATYQWFLDNQQAYRQ